MIKVNCPCGANLEVSAPGQFQAIGEQYRAKEFYEAHTSCLIHEAARKKWEAKEKALRELANGWFHEASRKDVPLLTSMAIDKCRRQLRAMCNEGEGR